ncbi:MAG: SurA N-terminal domain-containing protein [Hyphomicrobiales bacterium]|nr:SurA N-terminal domain-containing protein [Hyphomicrobiales bacterium]
MPGSHFFAHTVKRLARSAAIIRLFACALAGLLALESARADLAVVTVVNGDPISSYEVDQRQRFLAMTSGFGDEMKKRFQAAIKSPETNQRFREFMQARRPQTKEEQKALQDEFIAGLQKTIRDSVIRSRAGANRNQALKELVDEKLMIQDAKKNGIVVSDDDVMQQFVRKTDDGKTVSNAEELFAQLRTAGVDPKTFKEKRRAQIAWQLLIRRLYASRVQTALSPADEQTTGDAPANALYELRLVKLAAPANADQKQLARLWSTADNFRQRFTSCDTLDAQAKLINASVVKLSKKPINSFTGETRTLLLKSAAGQMTPPLINAGGVETYAVCAKTAAATAEAAKEPKADKRQQELQRQAQAHLNSLKRTASIEPPLQ